MASSIDRGDLGQPLLLIQWVDLSARRRAEEARAELLLEHAARTNAEAMADRLSKLQALSGAIESLSLHQLIAELAVRLAELFEVDVAEVEIERHGGEPIIVHAAQGGGAVQSLEASTVARLRRWRRRWWSRARPSGCCGWPARAAPSTRPSDRCSTTRPSAPHWVSGAHSCTSRSIGLRWSSSAACCPSGCPRSTGLQLAAHYEAAGAEVGGDWYDAFALPGGRLGVVLGDVAGRGVPAASAMGQLRSVTRAFALADDGFRSPGEMLTRLNRHQLALGQTELFTVVYAIVDAPGGLVSWACAGHPPPLLRNGNRETQYLEGGEGLMGIEDVVYRDLRAPIGPGGILVFYTDGLIERRGESLDIGLGRLAEAVASGDGEPSALCESVLESVRPAEGQLDDDVTALFVKLT